MKPEELKRITVLQAMDSNALGRLAAALEEKEYAGGQMVFAQGDPGDAMYFIAHGQVHVEVRTDAAGSARKTLAVLETGDYFGEMSLFDQQPRSASAVATGETRWHVPRSRGANWASPVAMPELIDGKHVVLLAGQDARDVGEPGRLRPRDGRAGDRQRRVRHHHQRA